MKIKPNWLKKYPKQSILMGKSVDVIAYGKPCKGKIVRDDDIEPYTFLIKLENGQLLTGSECRWSMKKDDKQPKKSKANE